jgi:hypothetical protein
MEFRRTVLQATACVYDVLQGLAQEGYQVAPLGELALRLASVPALRFTPRARSRVWCVYALLVDEFQATGVDIPVLLTTVRRWLGWEFPRRFFSGITEMVNATDCDLHKESALVGDYTHARLSCQATAARCQLADLFAAHQDELRAVESALANAPPEQKNEALLAMVQKVLQDPAAALGERTCWPLGDLIIALEAPRDTAIYTTDSHFEILCKALGKDLFFPL